MNRRGRRGGHLLRRDGASAVGARRPREEADHAEEVDGCLGGPPPAGPAAGLACGRSGACCWWCWLSCSWPGVRGWSRGLGAEGTAGAGRLGSSGPDDDKAERASWPSAPKDAVPAKVQRVSDGDTFVATVKGRRERIRVIGVDTRSRCRLTSRTSPSARRRRTSPSTTWTVRSCAWPGRRAAGPVRPDAGLRVAGGRDSWNALLVAEGYAQQLTVPPNVTYELFRRLVSEARREDRGLWAQERQGSS